MKSIVLFLLVTLFAIEVNADNAVRITENAAQEPPDALVFHVEFTPDGEFVTFSSFASNLLAGSSGGQIYLHTRSSNQISRISNTPSGNLPAGQSRKSSISDDGRFVAFGSDDSTIVNGDTNAVEDCFLYDRVNDSTIRFSNPMGGGETTQRSCSFSAPKISGNGKFIAFTSRDTNLVAGDTNGAEDIFIYDVENQVITRESVTSDGFELNGQSYSPDINQDGTVITFVSRADNIFPGDGANTEDVYYRNITLGLTRQVNRHSDGTPANDEAESPQLSSDGGYVVYQSAATNLVDNDTNGSRDAFLFDIQNQTTERISQKEDGTEATGNSGSAFASKNAEYILFSTSSQDIISGISNSSNVLLLHRESGRLERVSLSNDGSELDFGSGSVGVTDDGILSFWQSTATNVIPGIIPADPMDTPFPVLRSENDLCPSDSGKLSPGSCGCGIADGDADEDGTLDCNEDCDNDANKTTAGVCGCGTADLDTDGNSIVDCLPEQGIFDSVMSLRKAISKFKLQTSKKAKKNLNVALNELSQRVAAFPDTGIADKEELVAAFAQAKKNLKRLRRLQKKKVSKKMLSKAKKSAKASLAKMEELLF